MLIEIHMLQNHVPSNLNRDDSNSPKECVFGGVVRARISSQCLKRSIRQSKLFKAKIPTMGIRTRKMPVEVMNRLIEKKIPKDIAEQCGKIAAAIGTKSDKPADSLETKQIMFFSEKEMNEIADTLEKMVKGKTLDEVKNIKPKDVDAKMGKPNYVNITPDIALFGRMVTSDLFKDIEASIQVAHAISTHKMEHEFDYYTAIDDLSKEESMKDQGAAMIGDIEFTSACYYKYFSIDANGFLKNMMISIQNSNAKDQAKAIFKDVLIGFLKAAVFDTPTGKQNTFAAHQLPDAILIEIKDEKIPVSYANAFLKPVTVKAGEDLVEASIAKLQKYIESIQKAYKIKSKHRLWLNTKDMTMSGATAIPDIDALCAKLEEIVTNEL